MAVRTNFDEEDKLFYITLTCYEWLPLIAGTEGYDLVYQWFRHLKEKYGIEVSSYVIMPNHLHCILSIPGKDVNLNKIIKGGKLFLARGLLKRLKAKGQNDMLDRLSEGVPVGKQAVGCQYAVFKRSFDAKAIVSRKFLVQKMQYIHLNPVRGNYNLVEDWRDYPHSSAGYYEYGMARYFDPVHYDELM